MTNPFRQNANGSVTVTEHKHPITISGAMVRSAQIFTRDGEAWAPKPSKCWECGAEAMYHTKDKRGGPELIWMTYECGECGMTEVEPFD